MPTEQLHAHGPVAYDALAPFYDRYWGPAFLDGAVGLFSQFLALRLPPNAHILDLCCGAGHFAAWLKGSGRRVTGVDASRSMIGYARKMAPGSEFLVADMKIFHLSSDFAATVCFYNSINQLLTRTALRSTLRTVAQHIQPGGWFLFDVVLEEGYARSWHADEVVNCDGRVCELTYRYNEQERLAICRVTVVESAAGAGTGSYEFFQRPHPLPLLLKKLHQSGFDAVQIATATGIGPADGRVAIVARRGFDSGTGPKQTLSPAIQIQRQEDELCHSAHDRWPQSPPASPRQRPNCANWPHMNGSRQPNCAVPNLFLE